MNKIKNLVHQVHWPHFQCSVATAVTAVTTVLANDSAKWNCHITTALVWKTGSSGQAPGCSDCIWKGTGMEGEGAPGEEGSFPMASGEIPPGWWLQRAVPLVRVSLAPKPSTMQLSHHTSFLGFMGHLSFSPAPGRLLAFRSSRSAPCFRAGSAAPRLLPSFS